MACCMVFMLLVQPACGQPPEPDPRTRVSVSVSAGRDQEGTQVVEILELCQLQDAATDPLLCEERPAAELLHLKALIVCIKF